MKKCPYCAEEIQEEAIKCKHCHEFLDDSKRPASVQPPALPGAAGSQIPWYCKTSFIVLVFLTLPPFALPSVWLHPKLHFIWKIVITAIIGLATYAMVIALIGLLEYLVEMQKMVDQMRL